MDISVIVPLYNEAESLPELEAWIERVMKANGFSYEIIFVNDGSTDASWKVINDLKAKSAAVKGVCFRRNYGKSPALNVGFERAGMEAEALRPAVEDDSYKAFQCHGAQGERHQESARFQLRSEGLSQGCG